MLGGFLVSCRNWTESAFLTLCLLLRLPPPPMLVELCSLQVEAADGTSKATARSLVWVLYGRFLCNRKDIVADLEGVLSLFGVATHAHAFFVFTCPEWYPTLHTVLVNLCIPPSASKLTRAQRYIHCRLRFRAFAKHRQPRPSKQRWFSARNITFGRHSRGHAKPSALRQRLTGKQHAVSECEQDYRVAVAAAAVVDVGMGADVLWVGTRPYRVRGRI